MAGNRAKKEEATATQAQGLRGKWQERIDAATALHTDFHKEGDTVVDRYRLERENSGKGYWQDKYNILYSSTETMRPSLYATTPKVQAVARHRDRGSENVILATMLMEATTQYGMEEIDFDDVLANVVEDYLLPGLGTAWVRYEPEITTIGEGEGAYEQVTYEGLALDYVYWKDFISDSIKVWQDKRWIARRVYFDKGKAKKRFGDKADRLQYSYSAGADKKDSGRTTGLAGDQAIIWEIWDKDNREVLWFSSDYPDGLLDQKPDPLKLRDFWPCPRPLRAVSTTSTFIPKAFYSQYKAQAETLDEITGRIRWLTKALRVVGVYDASQTELSKLLNGNDNRMVPVENWAAFAGQGGINGSIQWVPIKEIATVLGELYKQREIAKNEIYEITGFSDITRGVSKASETLGAQEIKNQWATGRLRSLQKEIQRFCRDIIRIMSEIIVENFSDESLAMYAGFEPPPITPGEQTAAAQHAQATMQALTLGQPAPPPPPPTEQKQMVDKFREVVKLVRDEKRRCALVGIETDSTIMPDEAAERKDRMEFLGQIGAFLQQAGPMALQYPDMRGLLGAIMMFTIRTFRASRPLEKEFEEFTKKLAEQPAMPPPGAEGEGGKQGSTPEELQADQAKEQLKAQTTTQTEQLKAQTLQATNAENAQVKKYEIDERMKLEREKMQLEATFKQRELDLKERELAVREAELLIKSSETENKERREDENAAHQRNLDVDNASRADREVGVKEKVAAKPTPKPKA